MVFARCVWFEDDGTPIGRGCKNNESLRCDFIHPDSQSWARAPLARSRWARKVKAQSASFSSRGPESARNRDASSQPGASTSSAASTRPASPERTDEPGPSNAFTFRAPPIPTPAGGGGLRRAQSSSAGPPKTMQLNDWFDTEEPPAVASGSKPAPAADAVMAASTPEKTSTSVPPAAPIRTASMVTNSSGARATVFVKSTVPEEQPARSDPPPAAVHPVHSKPKRPPTQTTWTPMNYKRDIFRAADGSVKPAGPEQPAAPDLPPATAVPTPPESSVPKGNSALEEPHALPDSPPAATNLEPDGVSVPLESPALQEKPPAQDIAAAAQPKSLADIQNDSMSFIKQLLDAVFKTHELKRVERRQTTTKRLQHSTRYERASKDTRAALDDLKSVVGDDHSKATGRLDSRVARLAGLPSVGEHLVDVAAALSGAGVQFNTYLADVEEWRSGYEPQAEKAYAEYEEQVRVAEEALAKDHRPDWLRKMPQLTRQYEQLVQLEQAANELKLERDGRYDEPGASLAQELVELLQQEDWPATLWKTAEDEQQYAADVRTMELVDDLQLQDVELRQQLVELDDAIDAVVQAAQDEEEPYESHAEYMERMRRKMRKRHEQHTERTSAIRAQHAQLDDLMKQPNPTAAPYDTVELAALIESCVQQGLVDSFGFGLESEVAQRLGVYKTAASNLANDTAECVGEAVEIIRLVGYYVDGNEQLRDAVTGLLAEQLAQEQLAAF